MELTSQDSLLELIAAQRPAPKRTVGPQRRAAKSVEAAIHYRAPVHKSKRCVCGTCATCRDNAKWDRIFAEKFADPTYYSRPMITHQSSLRPF